MKFCQPHWEKLRRAIDERGLAHLIAKGGEQAARNMAAELRQGASIQSFDPLMAAHNAIWMRAMDVAGLAVMAPNENGTERCPICFLNQAHAAECQGPPCGLPRDTAFDHWIDRAADMVGTQAAELLAAAKADA